MLIEILDYYLQKCEKSALRKTYHSNYAPVARPELIQKTNAMTNNIRVQRAMKNITQAELAKRIGVSRQTINSIESKRYVPSTKLALLLSKEFDISVNDIFSLDEEE